MAISREMYQSSRTQINMKITHLKCLYNFPGANELSHNNILCEDNPPATGDFLHQRPVLQNLDVFSFVSPNRLLNKQSSGQWCEMSERPRNVTLMWTKFVPNDRNKHRDCCEFNDSKVVIVSMTCPVFCQSEVCANVSEAWYTRDVLS